MLVLNEKSALIEMLRTDEPNQLTELLDQFKVPSYSENKLIMHSKKKLFLQLY